MASVKIITTAVLFSGCLMLASSFPLRSAIVKTSESIKKVNEGDTIELKCRAPGTQPIIIQWLYNGKHIEQSPLDVLASSVEAPAFTSEGQGYSTTTEGRLLISRVTAKHSGKYTCVSETMDEKLTQSFDVEVVSNTDKKISKQEKVKEAVRIDQISTMIMQDEGKSIYAVCRATQGATKSPPVIRWTLGDQILTEDNTEYGIKIHSNGDLEVSKANADFHCMNNNLTCHAYGDDNKVVSETVWIYMMPLE